MAARREWTEPDKKLLADRAAAGVLFRVIALELGRTEGQVSAAARYYRLAKRGRTKSDRAELSAHVGRLTRLGYSGEKIALELNLPPQTVRDYRRRLRLPPPRPPGHSRIAFERDESARLGWPRVSRALRVALEALEHMGGSATGSELTRHLGRHRVRCQSLLKSLAAAGHVAAEVEYTRGWPVRYTLEPEFAARRLAWLLTANRALPTPPEPTEAMPGTGWKVAVMAERFRRGYALFHPADGRPSRSPDATRFVGKDRFDVAAGDGSDVDTELEDGF